MKWLKFALYNVFRNRRRALTTILILSVGTSGILIGGGFADFTYESLREMAARDNGHLILAHQHYFDRQESSTLEFGLKNYQNISDELADQPGIRAVLPKLAFSGLISNGDQTTVFVGQGVNPEEFRVKGPFLNVTQGSVLSKVNKHRDPAVMIGDGLARILNAQVGSNLTLLSTTVEGSLNAIDVVVDGVFTTGVSEVDERILMVELNAAQSLLLTDKVSTVSVYLRNTIETEQFKSIVSSKLPQLAIQTWLDQAYYYRSVKGIYNRIFGILGIIILLMVFFAVVNTVSMTIVERTREIGTLRAMGTHRYEIVRNFLLESSIIAVASLIPAVVISVATSIFCSLAEIQMPPPPARSQGYPLGINIDPVLYSVVCLAVLLTCIAATWFISRRAAGTPIIKALTHV